MRQTMPTYTFKLLDDDSGVTDDLGIRLPNTKAAYGYACDVAHEMMDHREAATRSWRLDVYENGAKKLFEILFATIDETLDHLKPENRKLVEMTAMRRRSTTVRSRTRRRSFGKSTKKRSPLITMHWNFLM